MTSWSDRLDAAALADLDRLHELAVRSAQQRLAQASEFDPYGLLLDGEGRVLEATHDDEGPVDTEAVLAGVQQRLRHGLRGARAVAVVVNAHLPRDRSDAIEVRLEHREGAALLVLVPYRRPLFGSTVYSPARVFDAERTFWS